MGSTFAESNIRHQVCIWRDAQSIVDEYRVSQVERPCGCICLPVDAHEIVDPGLPASSATEQVRNFLILNKCLKVPEFRLPMLPCPFPRGPTPDAVDAREIIVPITTPYALLKIVAGNAEYPMIISIAFQHYPAKLKKSGVRKAVVFENDAFLHVPEKPSDTGTHGEFAAKVFVEKARMQFTLPIYHIDDRSRLLAQSGFVGPVRTRPIRRYVQLRWPCASDGLEHLPGDLGLIENQEQDRHFV